MHKYEIEIKSLLGNKESAEQLVTAMQTQDPQFQTLGAHKQLNHYFTGGNLNSLFLKIENFLDTDSTNKFKNLMANAKDFSVRTREADGRVILVLKASVDDTTSSNGTARLEWEYKFPLALTALDELILSAGFSYQAKWSRERQEYVFHYHHREISVSIDKNAGYGYLAEFEVLINDESKAEEVKNFIREVMSHLQINELPQDRLARMFNYYNQNWQEYYGTDKIFSID